MDLVHLKQLMNKHGMSQTDLAKILGRDKSVITNLFQGKRQLKAQEATLIARHIGVSVTQILGEERAAGMSEPAVLIPFQHEPVHNRKADSVIQKSGKFYLKAEESAGYTSKTYALEMRDDSMNLAGILPGDILISELDRACKEGQIVIAQYYFGKGAQTVVRKFEPPFLLPHSTSNAFKPLSNEQDDVRVVSPVLKLIRVF